MNMHMRTLIAALILAVAAPAFGADFMERDMDRARAFSTAVITEGGRTVWISGVNTIRDDAGKDISGDFDAQVRAIFKDIERTLKAAGGSLDDIVSTTTYVVDESQRSRFTQLRKEIYKGDHYPASVLMTIPGKYLTRAGTVVEVAAVAVIGDRCARPDHCLRP
jgi:2-iminobutanoate/2-iminopropanoate deaminase